MTPHVKIVEAALPEAAVLRQRVTEIEQELSVGSAAFLAAHGAGDALLPYLQDLGNGPFAWLAEEKMHVVGHEDIAHERELKLCADLSECL